MAGKRQNRGIETLRSKTPHKILPDGTIVFQEPSDDRRKAPTVASFLPVYSATQYFRLTSAFYLREKACRTIFAKHCYSLAPCKS
jgi:hypothetical protein